MTDWTEVLTKIAKYVSKGNDPVTSGIDDCIFWHGDVSDENGVSPRARRKSRPLVEAPSWYHRSPGTTRVRIPPESDTIQVRISTRS